MPVPSQSKLIKTGIRYTDKLFAEIARRLGQGVIYSDTIESFINQTKDYTTANPLVTTGYDATMVNLILAETNNHKFSRPAQKQLTRIVIEEKVGRLIQDVGEDIKNSVRDIVKAEYNKGSNPQIMAKQISETVEGIGKKRARTIARTEIARVSTISEYIVSKEEGATHFVVTCRSTRCEYCEENYCNNSETGGDVEFSIDDVDMLPPLHPNCRCVAIFYNKDSKFKGQVEIEE